MKILIAEDNRFYRCLLESLLTEWGHEVVVTANGLEAWDRLQGSDAPRLAILDWLMPGLDGFEVCKRVRALRRTEPTYLILLTAKGGKDNVIAGLEAGADDYINKPFDRDELRARLQVGLRIVGLQSMLTARVTELEQALSGAQKMEAVGRMAGGVAHDFNNLLTVILGYSDSLLAQLLPGDAAHEAVQAIKQAGERGAGLTRQLLAFSRKQVLTPVVHDLNTLVTGTRKMLGRLIGEDIELIESLAPGPCLVRADPGQMEQVIMNLVVNARDAMPDGGQIVVSTRPVKLDPAFAAARPSLKPGPHIVLEIADSGCGMDLSVRSHLFEPFFTTKEQGKGTGLGLATVYGIVRQSNGVIEVESEPGQGSTFRIYLPRAATQAPAPQPLVVEPPPRQGSEVVLLVEDEDTVRRLAHEVLRLNHYTVLEARNGLEAMQVSASWRSPIHLLLTDVVMPSLSGHQLADRLKLLRPEMRVLFMSGYTNDSGLHRRVVQPGNHYLQKPFLPRELARKVREVLETGSK